MRTSLLWASVAMAACTPQGETTDAEVIDQATPDDGSPRYADVQQKSTHNSYARNEAIVDQLIYHRVRSLEFDLHVGKYRAPELRDNWYVYHVDVVDDRTSCRTLVDCFDSVLAFTDAVDQHEVVTLWLDIKDDWDDAHSIKALDAAIAKAFGDRLLTPEDLVDDCPAADDVMDAVSECGWPRLDALQGRIVVALTGGGVSSSSDKLAQYLDEGRLAFVAPSVDSSDSAVQLPGNVAIANVGLCSNNTTSALGRDCDVDDDALAAVGTAARSDRVVRGWGIDSEDSWGAALQAGAHHLGTDLVNYERDPWARTHNDAGWPFTCDAGCDAPSEAGSTIALSVRSGDIWNERDSFGFASLEAARDAEWTAMVSTRNSHVEDFAKGCLMARTAMTEDAAYFAVCRPADSHRARAQIRPDRGASTEAIEADVVPDDTVDTDSIAWLRLVVDNAGHCASGYAAHRRGAWVHLGTQCFDEPLEFQGLAASAHDSRDPVRLLFVSPTRNDKAVETADLSLHQLGSAVLTLAEEPA